MHRPPLVLYCRLGGVVPLSPSEIVLGTCKLALWHFSTRSYPRSEHPGGHDRSLIVDRRARATGDFSGHFCVFVSEYQGAHTACTTVAEAGSLPKSDRMHVACSIPNGNPREDTVGKGRAKWQSDHRPILNTMGLIGGV